MMEPLEPDQTKPMTFEQWRETEEGWAADDGEEGAADRMVEAYENYVTDFEERARE